MIVINLQKAFDTVDHTILLGKMKWIGFSNKTIKWFHSYHTNRAFFVSLDSEFLKTGTINCGVPHESILGPLLFLLNINDIPKTLSHSHTYLYGDDTSIFYQHMNVLEIENVFNKEFANACKWFVDNKLSIHFDEDKTKLIFFSKEKNLSGLNITYDNNTIKQFHIEEHLGFYLDINFSGESMAMKSQCKASVLI